jgi:hypothetical protein
MGVSKTGIYLTFFLTQRYLRLRCIAGTVSLLLQIFHPKFMKLSGRIFAVAEIGPPNEHCGGHEHPSEGRLRDQGEVTRIR